MTLACIGHACETDEHARGGGGLVRIEHFEVTTRGVKDYLLIMTFNFLCCICHSALPGFVVFLCFRNGWSGRSIGLLTNQMYHLSIEHVDQDVLTKKVRSKLQVPGRRVNRDM